MKIRRLLYVAAGVTALQYAAHSTLFIGSLLKSPNPVADSLLAVPAAAGKTLWSLYVGYGLIAIVFGVLQITALLLCAFMPSARPLRILGSLLLLIVLLHAAVVWYFFGFFLPITFDLVVVVLIGATIGAASSLDSAKTAR
jgi:hypothetical protein